MNMKKFKLDGRMLAAFAAACIVTSNPARAADPSPWVKLGDGPALSLDKTIFAGSVNKFTSYLHNNGSRSDWAISGSFALPGPNMTIFIVRQEQPEPITYSLLRNLEEFSELKFAPHRYRGSFYAMNTKFGELRAVPFVVSGDGMQKYCVGFHKPESNKVFVKGFVCARDEASSTPQSVACLIDQIQYVLPADNEAIKARLNSEARECGATALNSKPDTETKAAKETL
jgi:hypothetical protein